MAKTNETAIPDDCRDCPHWPSVSERVRVWEVLRKTIDRMELELKKEDFKTTLADYLKLVHLEHELGDDGPKEIRATWVEPEKPTESNSGE